MKTCLICGWLASDNVEVCPYDGESCWGPGVRAIPLAHKAVENEKTPVAHGASDKRHHDARKGR